MITTEQAINLLASAYNFEVKKGGRGCGKTAFRTALLMGANALGAIEQIRWERDVAISQLEELGLGLGQKVDHVKELIDKNKSKSLVNYDNCGNKCISMRCPNCFEMVGSNCWKYCPECGQRIKK